MFRRIGESDFKRWEGSETNLELERQIKVRELKASGMRR
jgi:hypothetical protein